MGIINLPIDDEIKNKLEKLAKKQGFRTINEFLINTIEHEINLYEITIKMHDSVEKKAQTEDIVEVLSDLSEKLSEIKIHDEKIQLLVEFDEFFKKNKDLIKEKCPDMLVSILNSL